MNFPPAQASSATFSALGASLCGCAECVSRCDFNAKHLSFFLSLSLCDGLTPSMPFFGSLLSPDDSRLCGGVHEGRRSQMIAVPFRSELLCSSLRVHGCVRADITKRSQQRPSRRERERHFTIYSEHRGLTSFTSFRCDSAIDTVNTRKLGSECR
uniref:Putative secreted protein n=1 Tax=Anopheles marajoara TaxID=58244 RepID=A0A2M4C682_9DIPT